MTGVPADVAARIRRPPEPGHHIMEGSTPVVYFGNQPGARVATLGINPSRGEFAVTRYIACGVCVKSKGVDPAPLLGNAEVAGTVQFWEWIGDGATTFSF